MRRIGLTVLALLALGALSACSSSTPASPTPLVSGATINGSLVSPGGSGGTTSGSTLSDASPGVVIPSGLTVRIPGTTVTATIDPSGQFILRDVPSGTIVLQFSGPGVSATITLASVQNGQTVTITVSLTASSASIESDRRSSGGGEELEGRVESLPPTTPDLTLVVAGRRVVTDANTRFFLRGAPASFDALEIGQRVHVKGQPGAGTLLATSVDIQNTNVDLPVNLNGVMSAFTGTADAFTFEVNGRTVQGDVMTEFFGNSSFDDLADGRTVEVKCAQHDGFVYAARIHVSRDDASETTLTGIISAIGGTAPALTLSIGVQTVKTTASTEVRRKGDVQTLAALQVGMTVEVSGWLQTDGTITAKKIGIAQDAADGQFEMTGVLAGRSGTCPTIAFSVSGYAIATNALTEFTPACGVLTNGTPVKVIGLVQLNGTVLATKVKTQ
jgi:hypothetical protein